MGDRKWTELLDDHDRSFGSRLTGPRWSRRQTTGDGALATSTDRRAL